MTPLPLCYTGTDQWWLSYSVSVCRSVDEYSAVGATFTAASLFRSIGLFVGVFLGSFVLGCLMGLITALVSGGRGLLGGVAMLAVSLVDEVLQTEGLPFAGDQHVHHNVLRHLCTGRAHGADG